MTALPDSGLDGFDGDAPSADDRAAVAAFAPHSLAVLQRVVRLDFDGLTVVGQVDALVALERAAAWVAAQQQRLLADLSEVSVEQVPVNSMWWKPNPEEAEDEARRFAVRAELSCALRMPRSTVHDRLRDASALRDRFPGAWVALREAELTHTHVRVLLDETAKLPDDACGHVEDTVLARAHQQTVAQFRKAVRRAALAADPRSAEERHEAARAERDTTVRPLADGMAELIVTGPAEDVEAIRAATWGLADTAQVEARAAAKQADSGPSETSDGPDRRAKAPKIGALRFDAMLAMTLHVLTGCGTLPAAGDQHGRRPNVQVTVALSTLLGLDEQPAVLDGYGPVTPGAARRLAVDPTSTWRRLVTDPMGRLQDYGRTTYRPPQDLIDHVTAEHPTCRFPSCSLPSRRAEIDHRRAWTDGGPTNAANLDPLCTPDHLTKHNGLWDVERLPDGTLRWHSRLTGRVYDAPPHTLPIDSTGDVMRADQVEEPPPF
jgi:hypothetical protein